MSVAQRSRVSTVSQFTAGGRASVRTARCRAARRTGLRRTGGVVYQVGRRYGGRVGAQVGRSLDRRSVDGGTATAGGRDGRAGGVVGLRRGNGAGVIWYVATARDSTTGGVDGCHCDGGSGGHNGWLRWSVTGRLRSNLWRTTTALAYGRTARVQRAYSVGYVGQALRRATASASGACRSAGKRTARARKRTARHIGRCAAHDSFTASRRTAHARQAYGWFMTVGTDRSGLVRQVRWCVRLSTNTVRAYGCRWVGRSSMSTGATTGVGVASAVMSVMSGSTTYGDRSARRRRYGQHYSVLDILRLVVGSAGQAG